MQEWIYNGVAQQLGEATRVLCCSWCACARWRIAWCLGPVRFSPCFPLPTGWRAMLQAGDLPPFAPDARFPLPPAAPTGTTCPSPPSTRPCWTGCTRARRRSIGSRRHASAARCSRGRGAACQWGCCCTGCAGGRGAKVAPPACPLAAVALFSRPRPLLALPAPQLPRLRPTFPNLPAPHPPCASHPPGASLPPSCLPPATEAG